MQVPVIYTGKDKLVYFVEFDQPANYDSHGKVYANGVEIERFRTTYCNPFATHFNGKFDQRYLAARIPADVIRPNDLFVTIKIDTTKSDGNLNIREMGTHDLI
jgi:hypothetical protein